MPKEPNTPAIRRPVVPARNGTLPPALPRRARSVTVTRPVNVRKKNTVHHAPAKAPASPKPAAPTRRRMNQERIDQAGALRAKGVSYAEIGERVGCSERTVRRIAANVRPELHLPSANPDREGDPRALRERFLSEWMEVLHADTRLRSVTAREEPDPTSDSRTLYFYDCPPSILFLNEAERQLKERLNKLGNLTLQLMAREKQSQRRFVDEEVGDLYWDYYNGHLLSQNFGGTGDDWRPPSERLPIPKPEHEDPYGLDDD